MLRLGTWEGALEGVVEFSRQQSKTGGQAASSSENLLTQEHLSLRNDGAYILDPRLVTFSFGGDFGLSQERFSVGDTTTTRSGTLYGYDTSAVILSEKPYSLSLFANRSQGVSTQVFGGRTEAVHEGRGATLFARQIYVPSSLSFRQDTLDEETRAGSITSQRDETRTSITYQGDRGWEDSEGSLRYDFTDQSDHIFPNLSYQSHDGSLFYSLDFGPELNWRWDSRGRFFTRTGAVELTTATVDEALRIDHTDSLQTQYRYSLLRVESAGEGTTTHTGAFSLSHNLYQSLTTTLGLNGAIAEVPGGETESVRGALDLNYRKRIPWEGRLNIGLGGGVGYDSSRFRGTETFLPQETHTAATPFALPMQLGNPFVVTDSVVVTKTAFAPLPAGCIAPPGPPTPLVLGQDYTLRTVGDITEIVPIPCSGTTAGINPGDTIAVDYRFSVSPSLALITTNWHAAVSADYRWIRPYFSHEQSDQHLLSGQDGRFLDSVRSDTAGTELRYDGQRLQGSVVGEVRRYRSRRLEYDTVRSSQFVRFTILPELTLTLSADETWYDYSEPARHTRTLSGRATLGYAYTANLSADAFLGMSHLKDSLVPSERAISAGLRVRWTFRKVEIDPTLEFFDRRRGNSDSKDYRAMLHIIRRF